MRDLDIIDSDKDSHFTGALVQDAIENESINMPSDWQTTVVNKCTIKQITIESDQQLDFDLILYSKSAYSSTDLDLDNMIDVVNFVGSAAKQIAGANQYYYSYPLDHSIEYSDNSHTSKIHCGLINRSAVAKNAGATGEVKVRFMACPIG